MDEEDKLKRSLNYVSWFWKAKGKPGYLVHRAYVHSYGIERVGLVNLASFTMYSTSTVGINR